MIDVHTRLARWGVLTAAVTTMTLVACGARTNLSADERQFGTTSTFAFGDASVCTESAPVRLARQESTVMVLVDRSASMLESLDGAHEGTSRWSVLTSALDHVLASVDDDVRMGMTFFPAENVCDVATAFDHPNIAPSRSQQLRDSLWSTYPGGGKTPTFAALALARDALLKFDRNSGTRAVVLVTDGAPNCANGLDPATCECTELSSDGTCASTLDCLDAKRPLEFISRLYAEYGIPTYVIGLSAKPASPYYQLLEGMAASGGRPRKERPFFYPGTSASALEDVLDGAFREVTACNYKLPDPIDPGILLQVMIDDVPIRATTTGSEGWTWSDPKTGTIELHAKSCAAARGHVVTAKPVCQ